MGGNAHQTNIKSWAADKALFNKVVVKGKDDLKTQVAHDAKARVVYGVQSEHYHSAGNISSTTTWNPSSNSDLAVSPMPHLSSRT